MRAAESARLSGSVCEPSKKAIGLAADLKNSKASFDLRGVMYVQQARPACPILRRAFLRP